MVTPANPGKIISVNGFDMYYEIHGKGVPLLLLHGFTGSGTALIPIFKQLTDKYQLIVPDLRGHGRSTNPSKQFTFKQSAADIFELLTHLNIQSCSAVGFSGGGCTLLHLAYQHPEILKSMTIVSAAPYFSEESRRIMRQYNFKEKTKGEWEAMRSIHFHGDAQIEALWRQASMFSESYDDMNFTKEKLAKIKAKTLIVQGDRDPIYPIDLTIEMYKGMNNAYLWIIPDGGHVPIAGNLIDEFMNYIKRFCNE